MREERSGRSATLDLIFPIIQSWPSYYFSFLSLSLLSTFYSSVIMKWEERMRRERERDRTLTREKMIRRGWGTGERKRITGMREVETEEEVVHSWLCREKLKERKEGSEERERGERWSAGRKWLEDSCAKKQRLLRATHSSDSLFFSAPLLTFSPLYSPPFLLSHHFSSSLFPSLLSSHHHPWIHFHDSDTLFTCNSLSSISSSFFPPVIEE